MELDLVPAPLAAMPLLAAELLQLQNLVPMQQGLQQAPVAQPPAQQVQAAQVLPQAEPPAWAPADAAADAGGVAQLQPGVPVQPLAAALATLNAQLAGLNQQVAALEQQMAVFDVQQQHDQQNLQANAVQLLNNQQLLQDLQLLPHAPGAALQLQLQQLLLQQQLAAQAVQGAQGAQAAQAAAQPLGGLWLPGLVDDSASDNYSDEEEEEELGDEVLQQQQQQQQQLQQVLLQEQQVLPAAPADQLQGEAGPAGVAGPPAGLPQQQAQLALAADEALEAWHEVQQQVQQLVGQAAAAADGADHAEQAQQLAQIQLLLQQQGHMQQQLNQMQHLQAQQLAQQQHQLQQQQLQAQQDLHFQQNQQQGLNIQLMLDELANIQLAEIHLPPYQGLHQAAAVPLIAQGLKSLAGGRCAASLQELVVQTRGKHWFEPGDLAALLGSGMRALRRVQLDLKVQLVQAGVAGTLEERMRERLLQVRSSCAAL
jgi:hypothetical protein